jgi:hypothetical protein
MLHCPENWSWNLRPCPFHGPEHLTYQLPSGSGRLATTRPSGRRLLETPNSSDFYTTDMHFSTVRRTVCLLNRALYQLQILLPWVSRFALSWCLLAIRNRARMADGHPSGLHCAASLNFNPSKSPPTILLIPLAVLFLFPSYMLLSPSCHAFLQDSRYCPTSHQHKLSGQEQEHVIRMWAMTPHLLLLQPSSRSRPCSWLVPGQGTGLPR